MACVTYVWEVNARLDTIIANKFMKMVECIIVLSCSVPRGVGQGYLCIMSSSWLQHHGTM